MKVHIFDADLNPATAKYRGYEYIDDVLLDKSKGDIEAFLKVMSINRIKLGIPKRNEHAYYGLYIPLKDIKNQTNV